MRALQQNVAASRRLDEIQCLARLLTMSEAARLRNQAQRCRRLAENVSTDQDQAMFWRVAKDFDEAADELEKKTSRPLSTHCGN